MENFKEKFKKALEKAKAYHNDYTKDIMEEIFPELKESEDEKVRKELIDALEHFVRSIGESGYASPCDNNTKLLYSLLEQLKKLRDE